jgi:glycosyltransferase involved in cell wall biosynthesis
VLALGHFEAPVARKVAQECQVPNVTRLFGCFLRLDDRFRFLANYPEIVAYRTPADLMIVTNDGSQGDRAARQLGFPLDRFVYLRNGLDFSRFCPGPSSPQIREQLGIGPDQPLLITVTRLALEKKLERAIDAMPRLLERVPGAVLALVGDGPERARLVDQVAHRGLAHAVRFPGAVEHGRLPEWYRTADLVLSLLDRTNASNPVFETMACARLPVALDSGQTRDLIEHGKNGIVVTSGELPRLGDILADLIQDAERRERLAQAAGKHIRELLVTVEERLAYEVDLLEAVAAGRPIERRLVS